MEKSQIAARIKKVRKAKGLSQAAFAQIIGVHRAHISRVETGTANPSKQLLKLICSKFKIREEWLLEGKAVLSGEGLEEEEIEAFELNTELISKTGLFYYLDEYAEIFTKMYEKLFEFKVCFKEIGEPDDKLLKLKEEIETSLTLLKYELSSLFNCLTEQKEPNFLKKWRSSVEKIENNLKVKKK